MINTFRKTIQLKYPAEKPHHHWSPESEVYSGGDSLVYALHNGWTIEGDVICTDHWHGGIRRVRVYDFALTNGDIRRTMTVIQNPFVDRLLARLNVPVISLTADLVKPRLKQ